ncbi:MAG: YHS domain-containing protein, partial [Candidatus Aminicenantales bacterium]
SKILVILMAFVFIVVFTGIAQQQTEETVTCPVSGKVMKKSEAKASYEFEGKTYYFCSEDCKTEFVKNPARYTKKQEEAVTCPVSGKKMKKSEAKASYQYQGKTYYFCSEKCKTKFMKDPEKYIKKKEGMKAVYTCPMHPEVKSDKPGKCPQCGMALQKKMMPMKKGMMHHEMKAKEGACCSKANLMSLKDIEVNVENLDNGVVVKITSKDPEVVKKLQAYAVKMKEKHSQKKAACAQKTEKKEIK